MFCRLCPPHMKKKYSRPTSLNYDRDGEEILVSYSTDYIYCFNLRDEDEERKSAIEVGEGAPEARSKEVGQIVENGGQGQGWEDRWKRIKSRGA